MDNQNMLVFAFDGDNIGKRHAKAVLSDNLENIHNVSSDITDANEMVKDFVESHGGEMISFGGDEGIFIAPQEFVEFLEQLRKDYEYMVGATLSIGYGNKPSEAGKALIVAKNRGKNQIVKYDESVENESKNEIESEKESTNGYANEISSDGITKDNTPVYDNNHKYDSGYKNSNKKTREDSYREEDLTPPIIAKPNLNTKNPILESTSDDFTEAARPMNNVKPNPEEKSPEDKKPVSKYYNGQTEWIEPNEKEGGAPQSMSDSTNENRPSDLKYTDQLKQKPQKDMDLENSTSDLAEESIEQDMDAKENPIEEIEQHCPSCTCNSHDQSESSMDDVMDQHVKNAKDFNDTIDEKNNENDGDFKENIEEILDQHLDNAKDMENPAVNSEGMDANGISRPEDFDEKQSDMGLSEEVDQDKEEPQLDEVLKEGLDNHAENIKKEKAINMVGQALEAFKLQKKILDKAKEQAPELHEACINMLKAMIELCSLAGIDESQAQEDVEEIENQENSCPHCGHTKENKIAIPKEGSLEAPQQ